MTNQEKKNQALAKSRLISFRVLRTRGVDVDFALKHNKTLWPLSMSPNPDVIFFKSDLVLFEKEAKNKQMLIIFWIRFLFYFCLITLIAIK